MALTRLNNNAIGETITAAKGGTGVTSADEIGNMVLLDNSSFSDVASFSFDSNIITDTYKIYELQVVIHTATNNTNLEIHTSTDGGSTFNTNANAYAWVFGHTGTQGTFGSIYDQDDTRLKFCDALADGKSFPYTGMIKIFNPTDATFATTFNAVGTSFYSSDDDIKPHVFFGRRQATEDNNGIRFRGSSNITGYYALYGVKT